MLRLLRYLLLLAALAAATAGAALYWLANAPVRLRTSPLEFTVERGSTLRSAAQQLADAGVDFPPALLTLFGRLLRVESAIKAGSYEVSAGVTPLDLLRKLSRGDVSQAELLFVEGWTFHQLRERIDAHPDLLHDSRTLSDAEILQRLGAGETQAEGLFFPDTYLFPKHASDLDVLGRAYRAMQRHLAGEWATRSPGLPLQTPYDALTLASIVEKETGREADRPLIAAVFANRLRRGMLLQTDPTVIYGLGATFDGNLHKRNLLADTPYNTYTRRGLTPTPIACPGLASLHAALHPAPSEALYFVARGDGSSQFSRTLDEHNLAVDHYQKGGQTR